MVCTSLTQAYIQLKHSLVCSTLPFYININTEVFSCALLTKSFVIIRIPQNSNMKVLFYLYTDKLLTLRIMSFKSYTIALV